MGELHPIKQLRFVLDLDRRIEEAFAELIHEPWGKAFPPGVWQPAIDVFETGDAYLVEADLPGVAPEHVLIRIDGRRLSIFGTREGTARVQHSGRSLRVERACGDFCRVVDLESDVDVDQIEKQYEFGILHIRLPKRRPHSSNVERNR